MDGEASAQERFWALIDERQRSGADVAAIDARIWKQFGKTQAVVFTDLSGFSRQVVEYGILHFLQTIREQLNILRPVVRAYGGTIVKVEADSLLILFDDAATAVRCALAMQHGCQRASADRAPADRILLCVGIGYGRVLKVGADDVYGEEVNSASKLGEDTARAHEILLTDAAAQAAGSIEGVSLEHRDPAPPGVRGVVCARYSLISGESAPTV
jgi:class 3 adenylate cyclase